MSRVVHFEIHAVDPERMVKFYSDLFGWSIRKWDGPGPYWLIQTGPAGQMGIDGGLLVRKGGAPQDGAAVNAFVCTVGVESLDATLGKVVPAGGSIALPRMAVPGVGWLAYAKDPDGNLFGMLQPDVSAGGN
jgi:uncharacterized protein